MHFVPVMPHDKSYLDQLWFIQENILNILQTRVHFVDYVNVWGPNDYQF